MKTARLIKSTAIIASLTLFSRLLGLVRDILIASFLGAGAVSDAFFTAFKLPNVFRRMFAEGAFNAAFVPLYARKIEEETEESANQFASEIASMLATTQLSTSVRTCQSASLKKDFCIRNEQIYVSQWALL